MQQNIDFGTIESSFREIKSRDYLEEKKMFDMLNYLIGHLLVDKPPNALDYLFRLLDDLILFRSGLKNARFFWATRHIDAVFHAADTNRSELLCLENYTNAMKILDVRRPIECTSGEIDKLTFRAQALKHMNSNIATILRKDM